MKFKVGDVVITKRCVHQNSRTDSPGPVGVECTIIRVSQVLKCYETDLPCETAGGSIYPHWWGCDNCFELKPPPRQEVSDWESCVWKPCSETVTA